jgi:RNA polymerase sigma factor (sigma-70 family)
MMEEHLFRHESGKMVAALTKFFGFSRVDIAEDIVQETLLTALHTWKTKGIPDNPSAWLYRVAKNNAINYLRRERHFQTRIAPHIAAALDAENEENGAGFDAIFLQHEIEDAQLRLMFACCHPALSSDVQLILILKTLCGLHTREIAAALLTPEDTVAKRLYRAKEKIKSEHIHLEVPFGTTLDDRFEGVLKAVYLLFNEGYKSSSSDAVIRHDLSEEALRLGLLLCVERGNITAFNLRKANALMALMCFHAARFGSRLDDLGQIVLLEDQNREKWDRFLISRAYSFLKASASGDEVSTYHIEAAIASHHAQAASFDRTDWTAIYHCYHLLYRLNPTAIVAFNRAIARGYAEGPLAGIDSLTELTTLDKNHFYHAALGDFYQKSHQPEAARVAYERALQHVVLDTEKKVILKKMAALEAPVRQ